MVREKILVIDDEEKMLTLLKKFLKKEGYHVECSLGGTDAISKIEGDFYDLVLTDIKMPELSGMNLLKLINEISPDTVVIMMTAFGTIHEAVAAIKEGAYHYITKPFKMNEVLSTVKKGLHDRDMRHELALLRGEVGKKYEFSNIIGKSKKMLDVLERVKRVADSMGTVLLYGKSGTGKEIIAKALHYNSYRRNGPFLAINCATIPEALVESELFGYVKGSFTGALTNKRGIFDEANGGTLFLDEIGDIPLFVQAKLLRVIQEKEIRPVGSSSTRTVDVRLITATNTELDELITSGKFRMDLYYRLNVISIRLPELKEKKEDIPLLVDHFLKHYSKVNNKHVRNISRTAMDHLLHYDWPGNVRELENVIERAVILTKEKIIDLCDILPLHNKPAVEVEESIDKRLEDLEVEYIRNVLKRMHGNQTKAAEILGIDRRTLYRKIKKHNIET